jgi:hypothetical protein
MSTELDQSLTQRTRGLLLALAAQLDETKLAADACVALAWQAGQCINEAKASLPGQHMLAFYDAVGITPDRALVFSRLATRHPTIEDLREQNARRQGWLDLGLLPDKERPSIDGDVQLRPAQAHCLGILNVFNKWHRAHGEAERDEARRVLRPVYEKLQALFTE